MTMGETTDHHSAGDHVGDVGVSPTSATEMRDRTSRDTQYQSVSISVAEDEGTTRSAIPSVAVSPILLSLRQLHRAREMFVKTEVAVGHQILQIDASLGLCEWVETRPGHGKFVYVKGALALESPAFLSAKAAMVALRRQAHDNRMEYERMMRKEARRLAVWPWVETVRGAGDLGLAQIVAEAGDLSGYDGPAKLWKRFGLAMIDGEAQARRKGEKGERMGFSPRRRKLMHVIADSLMKGNRDGVFRAYYVAEKAKHLGREGITRQHAHNRAMRALAKEYLEHLWRAWRAAESGMTDHRSSATHSDSVRIPLSAEHTAA
jgi:hypothetical protein